MDYNAAEKLQDGLEEEDPKNGWLQGKATRTTRNFDIEAVGRREVHHDNKWRHIYGLRKFVLYNYTQNPSDLLSSNLTHHNLCSHIIPIIELNKFCASISRIVAAVAFLFQVWYM